MLTFIVRRLVAAIFIVLGASFIVYIMMANAGDPLAFAVEITNPVQREQVIRSVTEDLKLDLHPVPRYFAWLGDLIRGDFGISARTQQPVIDDLASRVPLTLKLVGAAFILSVLVGTAVGIVTALRQYSGFDYITTFFTFVFFSLPVFWVAVILKGVGGINFNDWLRDGAHFAPWFIAIVGIAATALAYSITGGRLRRRLPIAVGVGVLVTAVVIYISATQWMLDPGFGPVVIAIFAVAIAYGVTAVMAGTRNRKALYSAMTTAAIGVVLWFPLQRLFDQDFYNLWWTLGLGVVAVLVGAAVGYAYGGFDKGLSARTAGITALLISVVVFVDRAMQSWQEYSSNSVIRGRPIKTIGDREGRLEGSFWVITNDTFSHLILPTLALMLISVATYTRYSRASMLEVLNQDYIRTARAKGLTERTVVVRHGFRNAMIPLATVVAVDTGALLGGAVVTETVFEWNAMGRMFITGLQNLDPNPVMGFFVVIAVFAVLANLVADLMYAWLDPRIRITD
jgi:peptide/nickel transport system permease protein